MSPSGNNPVSKFLDSLSPTQQNKLIRIFKHLETHGVRGPKQHLKKLSGTPLWEIRLLGKDNIRIVYAVVINNQVLLLHGFIKKKRKTPKKEIEISLTRYREWVNTNTT